MGSRLENPLGMTTAFCQAEAPEQESTRAVPTLHSPRNSLPANQTPRFSLGLGFFFPPSLHMAQDWGHQIDAGAAKNRSFGSLRPQTRSSEPEVRTEAAAEQPRTRGKVLKTLSDKNATI